MAAPARDDHKPVNVRIVLRDGSEIPVELKDHGVDGEGIHRWEAETPLDLRYHANWKCDIFPAKTALSFPVVDPLLRNE